MIAQQVSCPESEKGIVSICAGHPEAIRKTIELLPSSACIKNEQFRTIFEALVQLHESCITPNPIALRKLLKDTDSLELVGGIKAVNDVFDNVLPLDNLESFCETVVDWHKRRNSYPELKRILDGIFDKSTNIENIGRILESVGSTILNTSTKRKEWLKFLRPSECADWEPPSDWVLVGENHIQRGNFTLLIGHPGVGKSRAALALAICGVTLQAWFGLKIHSPFKTLIIQNENGRFRLREEFRSILESIECENTRKLINDSIMITEPPPFGMAIDHPEFRSQLRKAIEAFQPAVVILDPWTSVTKGDQKKDYGEALDNLKDAMPKGEISPAVVIVAHTRKPQGETKKTGRELIHEVAGSFALAGCSRSGFAVLPASNDTQDDRVVFECYKNNDGPEGERTAWHRRNGPFDPCPDFDWEAYFQPTSGTGGRPKVYNLEEILDLLPPGGMTSTDWLKAAGNEHGISKATFNRMLKECKEAGRVHYSQVTKNYQKIITKHHEAA